MKRSSFGYSVISFIRGFIFSVAIMASVFSPVYAQTQEWSGVCVGPKDMVVKGGKTVTDASDVATIQGVQCLLANIFSVIISVIGLAGFVMFIVGSFRYLLSGGNSKGTETAKNTFTFMVIGIIVALSGFILLNLLSKFTGISIITNISIPSSEQGIDGNPSP